jgi:peptide/nickel transport system permease protein
MLNEAKGFLLTAWWMVTLPGLAIVLVGLALSLFGDGVAAGCARGTEVALLDVRT